MHLKRCLEVAGREKKVVSVEFVLAVCITGWWMGGYVTAVFPDRGINIKQRQYRCELGGSVFVGFKTILGRETRGLGQNVLYVQLTSHSSSERR